MIRLIKKYRLTVMFLLVLGAISLWHGADRTSPDELRVSFFDVGQGDATFFETPGGTRVLIDGGPKQMVVSELAKVMPFWDRTIDLVIATHPQLDHISGLVSVLERYRVKRILLNGAAYKLTAYAALLQLVEQKQVPVTLARAGETLRFDHGIVGYILHPTDDVVDKKLSYDINETSVVLRLDYGQTSFLFTGDAGFYTEERLVAQHAPLDVDMLKVGHHGSKYASSESFLHATTPRVAVIEVGAKNTYGHPTPETLQRLAAAGATVFRTDTHHTVTISTNGKNVVRVLPDTCFLLCVPKRQLLFTE